MSLRKIQARLARIEAQAPRRACPECGHPPAPLVFVEERRGPDGATRHVPELPRPCRRCGNAPFAIVAGCQPPVEAAGETAAPPAPPAPFVERLPSGSVRVNWHKGQRRAWDRPKRFVCVIAGHQSGKTEMGPHWLHREIKWRGPGDYVVAPPTNPLLVKKALPAFCQLFEQLLQLGTYKAQRKTFEFSPSGTRGRSAATCRTSRRRSSSATPPTPSPWSQRPPRRRGWTRRARASSSSTRGRRSSAA